MGKDQKKIVDARKKISELIIQVLVQRLCVREAIKQFPPDIKDSSVECAWHALVHYEADEDFRKNDAQYRQEQDEYLEMIAFMLKEGKELPENIINSYKKYHTAASIPNSKGFLGWNKSLIRFTI
jgi:hypothetical protein